MVHTLRKSVKGKKGKLWEPAPKCHRVTRRAGYQKVTTECLLNSQSLSYLRYPETPASLHSPQGETDMRSPRGYDVAGVGGGEFAFWLVLRQRAAPHNWRSSSHTLTHTYLCYFLKNVELLYSTALPLSPNTMHIPHDDDSSAPHHYAPMPSHGSFIKHKLPWVLYCNNMVDLCVARCGQIQPCNRAAATCYGVHFPGKFWTVGGLVTPG